MNPMNLIRKIRLALAGKPWPNSVPQIGEWQEQCGGRVMRRLLPSGDFEYRKPTAAEWDACAPYGDYPG